jgi:two-component system C4-dicarboxylate transport response regulator DctD
VDLRIIAASKVDLGDSSQRETFREDLYFRLNVVTIAIPPLRERRDDIPLLFSYFADRAATRFDREAPSITPAIGQYLRDHHWPGNVRELSHFAERVVLGLDPTSSPARQSSDPETGSLPQRLERYEAEIIRETLTACDGDVQQTIASLGIPRKTFYDKLQRHGIVRSEFADKRLS